MIMISMRPDKASLPEGVFSIVGVVVAVKINERRVVRQKLGPRRHPAHSPHLPFAKLQAD
jgi:hypothetical protein